MSLERSDLETAPVGTTADGFQLLAMEATAFSAMRVATEARLL